MSGKGSSPRPFSVDRKTFENNWDKIFKNEYQDELSTEDCVILSFENNSTKEEEAFKELEKRLKK